MAGDTTITVVGNLCADPELRFLSSGAAVASFTVASTPRSFDKASGEWKDQEALYMRCNVWRQVAENVAESLVRGARVVVTGRLRQRSFETKEGEKRSVAIMAAALPVPGQGLMPALVFRFAKADGAGFYPPVVLVVDEDQMTKTAQLTASAVAAAIQAATT